MSWLEKNIDDVLIAAVLTAPSYVSGLTEAEYQFVKLQLERRVPPEIIEARDFAQKASAEIERGWRNAREKIAAGGGLDGSWSAAA